MVTIVKRRVIAKQVSNLWDAIEIRDAHAKPGKTGAVLEIERTSGGGMSSYRVVALEHVDLHVPERPETSPLPHPDVLPTARGHWRQYGPNAAAGKANQEQYDRNARTLGKADQLLVAPMLKA